MIRRITKSRRPAVVTVEMAVLLPVLLVFILGMIEFGRAIMVSNIMTTAAREGAREAALPNKNNDEVRAVVQNRLAASGITVTTSDIVVQVNGSSSKNAGAAISGDTISISVSVPVGNVTWLPTNFFLNPTRRLQGQAIMRRE